MSGHPSDSSDTRRLLDEADQGASDVFETLFARHRKYLHQVVSLRLNPLLQSLCEADDIMQEVHVEAYRRWGDYLRRRPMSFRIWLRKTAQQAIQKAHRRYLGTAARSVYRQVQLPEQSSVMLLQRITASGTTPEQHVIRDEQVERLQTALGQLAETDREILMMRTFEGLAYQEIADVLELESAAARKRYGRALLKLRSFLQLDNSTESPQ